MDVISNWIAVGCIIHFFWSYYRNCYSAGYSLDIWHFNLLSSLFVIHIMLPFARSDLNVIAIGPDLLRHMQTRVDQAYLISAFGYVGVIVGGSLWRFRIGLGVRNALSSVLLIPSKVSLVLLQSRLLLILNGIAAILMMAGVLAVYFRTSGFGMNLRSLLLVSPQLRPIAQFVAFYSVLIGSYCFARGTVYKEASMFVVVGIILVGLLFFGERSNLASVFSLTIMGALIKYGRRIKIMWLLSGAISAIFLALMLDAVREPDLSFSAAAGGSLLGIFFGNSFSDTRDFAIVLSLWDGTFLLGKTYLAGVLAFIPRFLSSFRDTWSLGVVTATIAGFSPEEHPGLRIGLFGEAYINFGLAGVFVLSLFVGTTIRLVDTCMKSCAALLPSKDMRIYSFYILLVIVGVAENSSNASTFYSIMLVLGISWFMLMVLRQFKVRT